MLIVTCQRDTKPALLALRYIRAGGEYFLPIVFLIFMNCKFRLQSQILLSITIAANAHYGHT